MARKVMMSAAFLKSFLTVKIDVIKLNNISALVVASLVVLIQGCASTGAPYEKTEIYTDATEDYEAKLARKLGEADVGEMVAGVASAGSVASEYTITDEYMAASGNTCRNVEIAKPETAKTHSALFCQDADSNWYRARDILLK